MNYFSFFQWNPLRFINHYRRTQLGLVGTLLIICSGCAATGLPNLPNFLGGGSTAAGIPVVDRLALDRITTEKRTEFPEEHLSLLPRKERPAVKDTDSEVPTLSLRGKALGTPPDTPFLIDLYTDKTTYSMGRAEIISTNEGEENEFWPIIAYDNVGSADHEFDFIYLLNPPEGGVRYLVVNGGEYKESDVKRYGFEGTLITPGPDSNINEPAEVLKIDFGFSFPHPPRYEEDLELAKDVAKAIDKVVSGIQDSRNTVTKIEEELNLERNRVIPEGDKKQQELARQQKKIVTLEKKLTELQIEIDQEISSVHARFFDFFLLRQSISNDYAQYIASNQYLWLPTKGKEKARKIFAEIQEIDAREETAYNSFNGLSPDRETLEQKHGEMQVVIAENGNMSKE
ncbi:MAG: hypothetical protein KJ950_07395 [Proteobacteria bacterium]|nr:hypothetical protein [Pseudomonadota bacterium]MBU1687069.1 hypothetical protein [Pseudomonadota bacterium]